MGDRRFDDIIQISPALTYSSSTAPTSQQNAPLLVARSREATMLHLPPMRSVLAGIARNRLVLLVVLIGASFLFRAHSSFALPASPGKVPNGNVFLCNTCHLPDPA